MKTIIPLLLFITGCSYLHSTTERIPNATYAPIGTNTLSTVGFTERTSVRVYTLFDGQANLTRFNNKSGYSTNGGFSPGSYVGTLNEASTSTNLVDIIGAVAKGVASGLK